MQTYSEKYKALEESCLAATGGTWRRNRNSVMVGQMRICEVNGVAHDRKLNIAQQVEQSISNAQYMVDAQPATVLEMIRVIKQLEAELAQLRGAQAPGGTA